MKATPTLSRSGTETKTGPATKPRFLFMVVACCLVLAAGFWYVLTSKPQHKSVPGRAAPEAPVATVTWGPVQYASLARSVSTSGTVQARFTADLASESAGLQVIEVLVEEGDRVRAGQVLARLNSSLLRAQMQQQQARLRAAEAAVEKARQPNRTEDIMLQRAAVQQAAAAISQEEAALQRAQTNLSNLTVNANRYRMLNEQGAISTQEADDRRTSAAMAASEVEAARRRVEAAKFAAEQAAQRFNAAASGGRAVDIEIASAEASQVRAAIKELQSQIAQTVIKAPAAGLITRRHTEKGEVSTLGQPLFTMVKDGELELRAEVPEIDLPEIGPGQAVVITPAAPGAKAINARVREIGPVVDARTRLGTAYITLPSDTELKQGMFARAVINIGRRAALAVPTKSVLVQDGTKVVFVLHGNRVQRRVVETGTVSGEQTEIVSGLQPEEKVVVAGAGFLRDGDLVSVSATPGGAGFDGL